MWENWEKKICAVNIRWVKPLDFAWFLCSNSDMDYTPLYEQPSREDDSEAERQSDDNGES